jgi:hypothetical protein
MGQLTGRWNGRSGRLGLDHGRQMVACFKQGRDDIGINCQRAGSYPLQYRFDAVGKLRDGAQAHHGRGPLQAVGRPEGLVEVRTIALTPLQVHQSLFETNEELTRFLVKHLPESVVRTVAQIVAPSSTWQNPPNPPAQLVRFDPFDQPTRHTLPVLRLELGGLPA